MQISKNTSTGVSKGFLVKMILVLIIITSTVVLLGKIDFPSPNQEIETIIDNRLTNRDDVASLIIEIGHKVVIKSFKKNGILT